MIHVITFVEPDARCKLMQAVVEACAAARVSVPAEVVGYFREVGTPMDDAGLVSCGAMREYAGDGCSGYDILVTKLPAGTAVVRVYST